MFDKLVQVLVLGAAYAKIADGTCSATTIRRRLDEWIKHGVLTESEDPRTARYPRLRLRHQQEGNTPQTGARWVVERTNSWHTRGFRKLQICTEVRTRVIDAFIALAAAIITTRRLIRKAWTRYRWDTRPTRRP